MENGNASASLLYFILGPIIYLFDDWLPQFRQDITRGLAGALIEHFLEGSTLC